MKRLLLLSLLMACGCTPKCNTTEGKHEWGMWNIATNLANMNGDVIEARTCKKCGWLDYETLGR